MRLDVHDIKIEGLEVEQTFRVGPLVEADGSTVELDPVSVQGHVRRLRLGYEFRGEVKTAAKLLCSRCLESFRYEFDLPFEIFYRDEAPENSPVVLIEDPAISSLENGRIHLGRLAEEQITLALPLKPLCSSGCHGLCPQCGARRDGTNCGCEAPVATRLGALKELRQRLEDGAPANAGGLQAETEERIDHGESKA